MWGDIETSCNLKRASERGRRRARAPQATGVTRSTMGCASSTAVEPRAPEPEAVQSLRRELSVLTDRAQRLQAAEPLWAAVEAGEVLLLRSSFVIDTAASGKPMPCRQQIELHHPDAIISAEELRALHAAFITKADACSKKAIAQNHYPLTPFLLPLVVVSHAWHAQHHPDPELVTLRAIAAELERQLGRCYRPWGFSEVGVFFE